MFEWLNIALLCICSVLSLFFYVKSAGPAALEKKIGEIAYSRCSTYRIIALSLVGVAVICYLFYYFFPLQLQFPSTFPWDWWISILIAMMIAIPGGYLWYRGVNDAGEETVIVKKEHTLYSGIYLKIRHPQTADSVMYWWVLSFLLHSPFLVMFSLVWLPIFIIMGWAEEKDLIIRYGDKYLDYRSKTGFIIPRRRG